MKRFFCLVLCFCLTNCTASSRSKYDYDEIVDKISAKYVKKICRNKEFRLAMVGGGIGGKISLGFDTIASLGIPEVRILLIQKEEEFLALINGTHEIQPYLDSPSSAQKVSIKIGFFGSDKNFVPPPYIAYAYIDKNTIYYGTYDLETGRLVTIFEEPYDEAYKIVYGRDRE